MRILRNNLFILRFTLRYGKLRLFLLFVQAVLEGAVGVSLPIMISLVTKAASQGETLSRMLLYVAGYTGIVVIEKLVLNLLSTTVYPILNENIKRGVLGELYRKSLTVDMKDMDDPGFYDSYRRSLDEAGKRFTGQLDTLAIALGALFTVAGYATYITIVADPVVFLFTALSLVSFQALFMTAKKAGYALQMETTAAERGASYIRRLFFLPVFAKEVRTNDYSDLCFGKMDSVYKEIHRVQKKYSMRQALTNSLANLSNGVFGLLCVSFYLGWRFFDGKLTVEDFIPLLVASIYLAFNVTSST